MIEKLRRIVESLGYPFFFGTREEVYAYINSVLTVVACYRQGGGGVQQFFVFKFKGDKPQRMYEEVMREIKRQFTVGVQRVFFYEDVLEARFPLMAKTYTGGGVRPTPPPPPPPHVVPDYLSFTVQYSGSFSLKCSAANIPALSISYSRDKENWTPLTFNPDGSNIQVSETINISTGETVYLKGNNPNGLCDDYTYFYYFNLTGEILADGDVNTLIDGIGGENCNIGYGFKNLFTNNASLRSAPKLPALTLTPYCYRSMFYACVYLSKAPILPAPQLVTGCYREMFASCNQLKEIEVHATSWDTNNTWNWVDGVPTTGGTFKKPASTTIPTGKHGIPSYWTVEDF